MDPARPDALGAAVPLLAVRPLGSPRRAAPVAACICVSPGQGEGGARAGGGSSRGGGTRPFPDADLWAIFLRLVHLGIDPLNALSPV